VLKIVKLGELAIHHKDITMDILIIKYVTCVIYEKNIGFILI